MLHIRSSVDSKQGTSANMSTEKGFVKVPCIESTEDGALTVSKTNGLYVSNIYICIYIYFFQINCLQNLDGLRSE